MKHSTILPTIAIILFALTLPGVTAAKAPTTPDLVEVTMELNAPDSVQVTILQTWEGGAARDMRQSLDAYFGLASGDLSSIEAAQIEQASTRDVQNGSLPYFSFGGAAANVTNATVRLIDAVGPVEVVTPLTIRHDITATVPIPMGEMKIIASTPWNGTLTLRPPAGFIVLDGTANASEEAKVQLAAGRDATIRIAPPPPAESTASPQPDAAPTTPPPQESREPLETPRKVPGVTAGAAALAALAGAWLWSRRAPGRR